MGEENRYINHASTSNWYSEMHFPHKQCKLFKTRAASCSEKGPNPPTCHSIPAAQRQGRGQYLPWRIWEKGFSVTDCSTEEYMSSLHPPGLLNDLLHIVLILHSNTYTRTHTRRATVYQLALTEVQLGWNNKDNGMFNHAHDKQQWANFHANNSWIINSTKRQSLTCRVCSGGFQPWFIKGVWHCIDALVNMLSYQDKSAFEGHKPYRWWSIKRERELGRERHYNTAVF